MTEIFHSKQGGEIPVGSKVSFEVENQDQWDGPLWGTLVKKDDEFKIELFNGQLLTIGKGYDVYKGTIVMIVMVSKPKQEDIHDYPCRTNR